MAELELRGVVSSGNNSSQFLDLVLFILCVVCVIKLFYWYLELLCESFKCVALVILEINRWTVLGLCQSELPTMRKQENELFSSRII